MTQAEQTFQSLTAGNPPFAWQVPWMAYRQEGTDATRFQAFSWSRRAALTTKEAAAMHAGMLDFHGTALDGVEAVGYYDYAARRGHPGAAWRLGALYLRGKHVAQNYDSALFWLIVAIYGGHQQPAVPKLTNAGEIAHAQFQYDLALAGVGGYGSARHLAVIAQWHAFVFI